MSRLAVAYALCCALILASAVALSADQAVAPIPASAFSEYPIKTQQTDARYITSGPDGALWFSELSSSQIGRIATDGTLTEFAVRGDVHPNGITTGPDGNLWFTLDDSDVSRIGRITPSGTITLFTFPNSGIDYLYLSGIAAGPDGNLWFTYQDFTTNVNAIGRITPSGTITLTQTPTANSGPADITAGPDGNMWFTEAVGNIGRITTS